MPQENAEDKVSACRASTFKPLRSIVAVFFRFHRPSDAPLISLIIAFGVRVRRFSSFFTENRDENREKSK
jgi:hypothetical protein